MSKKTGIMIYLIAVAIFLALACSLNSIVLLGVDRQDKFTRLDQPRQGNSRVYYYANLETYDDLLETLYMSGWAYCRTDSSDENKTVELILQGENGTYSVSAPATTRHDVSLMKGDTLSFKNAVEVEGSTVGVRDGIYDVYLYVWENEDNYGLIRTGQQIIKTKDRFEELYSAPVDTELPAEASPLVQQMALVAVQGDTLVIDGWCFIDGADTYDQQVLVYVKSGDQIRGYSAKESPRMDVSQSFGNEELMYSGFTASIDGAADAEEYAVCVQAGDQFLRSDWISVRQS